MASQLSEAMWRDQKGGKLLPTISANSFIQSVKKSFVSFESFLAFSGESQKVVSVSLGHLPEQEGFGHNAGDFSATESFGYVGCYITLDDTFFRHLIL